MQAGIIFKIKDEVDKLLSAMPPCNVSLKLGPLRPGGAEAV